MTQISLIFLMFQVKNQRLSALICVLNKEETDFSDKLLGKNCIVTRFGKWPRQEVVKIAEWRLI